LNVTEKIINPDESICDHSNLGSANSLYNIIVKRLENTENCRDGCVHLAAAIKKYKDNYGNTCSYGADQIGFTVLKSEFNGETLERAVHHFRAQKIAQTISQHIGDKKIGCEHFVWLDEATSHLNPPVKDYTDGYSYLKKVGIDREKAIGLKQLSKCKRE
jgi:hypothetical protein